MDVKLQFKLNFRFLNVKLLHFYTQLYMFFITIYELFDNLNVKCLITEFNL